MQESAPGFPGAKDSAASPNISLVSGLYIDIGESSVFCPGGNVPELFRDRAVSHGDPDLQDASPSLAPTPISEAGAGWRKGRHGSEATSLYSVIVPDANPAQIPGVGQDCGLEDRFSKRLVRCYTNPEHDHYEVGGSSCGKPDCPRHWKTWARRGADRMGCKIWEYKTAIKGRHKPRHTILSIDDGNGIVKKRAGESDKANLRYFRGYFKKQALKLGGEGGSLVTHLWRTNDLVPGWLQDDRRWDWVRKQRNWRKFVKFSPHAHIIGYGFYDKPKRGDFAYKNMPKLEDRNAVESVAYYQLSHAPVGVGNSVVYWGCLQSGFLRVVSRGISDVDVKCQKCGAPMVYDDTLEIYLRRRSWAVYEILDGSTPKKRKRVPGDPAVVSAKERAIWGKDGAPVRHAALISDSG